MVRSGSEGGDAESDVEVVNIDVSGRWWCTRGAFSRFLIPKGPVVINNSLLGSFIKLRPNIGRKNDPFDLIGGRRL